MIKDFFIGALEKVVNQYIKCDSDYTHFLAPLADKIICVNISQPPLTLHLEFSAEAITFSNHCYIEPDCTMNGESFNFLKLALNKNAAITASGISIKGDTQVAQSFAYLCRNINIDWEEMLANVVGDNLAHTAGNAARQAASMGRECSSKIRTDVQEFLHHESKAFPTRIEVNKFLDKIDTLRHDVDRLTIRFKELKRKLG